MVVVVYLNEFAAAAAFQYRSFACLFLSVSSYYISNMLQAARLLLLWLLLVRTPTYSSMSHMRSRYHGRHISDVTSSSVANDNTLSQSDSPMTSRDVEL